ADRTHFCDRSRSSRNGRGPLQRHQPRRRSGRPDRRQSAVQPLLRHRDDAAIPSGITIVGTLPLLTPVHTPTGAPRTRRTGVAALWLLFVFSNSASALNPSLDISQYAHTSWKVRDGFLSGSILSIAQTPDGYLWIGTDAGLFRFDGINAIPAPLPAS